MKNSTSNKDKILKDKILDENIKRKLSTALEIPKEIILGLPLISIIGKEEINIENYKGILEYSENRIRLNTNCSILKIEGSNLFLKKVTEDNILIVGNILKVEYLI